MAQRTTRPQVIKNKWRRRQDKIRNRQCIYELNRHYIRAQPALYECSTGTMHVLKALYACSTGTMYVLNRHYVRAQPALYTHSTGTMDALNQHYGRTQPALWKCSTDTIERPLLPVYTYTRVLQNNCCTAPRGCVGGGLGPPSSVASYVKPSVRRAVGRSIHLVAPALFLIIVTYKKLSSGEEVYGTLLAGNIGRSPSCWTSPMPTLKRRCTCEEAVLCSR